MKVKTGSLQQRSLKAIFPPLIALLCAGCVSVVVRENIVCESGFRTAAAAFATESEERQCSSAEWDPVKYLGCCQWDFLLPDSTGSSKRAYGTLAPALELLAVIFFMRRWKSLLQWKNYRRKIHFLCSVIPSIKLVVIFVIVYHQPLVDIMGWVSSLHANHGCHRSIVNRWKSSDIISKGAVHHQVRLDRSVQDTKILSTLYEIQIFTCSFFKSLDRRT